MSKRSWVLSGVPLVLVTAAACGYSLASGVTPPRKAAELAERKPQKDLCSSRKAQQELKARVFAEADGIRGPGLANLDLLSSFTSVRVEEPLLKSRDDDLGVTICTGRFVLLLPPGAERGLGGRRYLHADVEYAALPASDGSGLVYQVRGADSIVYRLAAFNLRADQDGFAAATDFADFDPANLLPPQPLPLPELPPQVDESAEPFPDPPKVMRASLDAADEPKPTATKASVVPLALTKPGRSMAAAAKVIEPKRKKEALTSEPLKRAKKEASKAASKLAKASEQKASKPDRTEIAATAKKASKKTADEKGKSVKEKAEKQLADAARPKGKIKTASVDQKRTKEPSKKSGKPKADARAVKTAKLAKDAKPKADVKIVKTAKLKKAAKPTADAKAVKSAKLEKTAKPKSGAKATAAKAEKLTKIAKPAKLAKSDVSMRKAKPAAVKKKSAKPAPIKATVKRQGSDCDSAATVTDRLLCGNPRLAAKKRAASNYQNAAMEEADPDTRRVLNRTRGQFADYVHRCASESCLDEAYEQRMEEIRDIMDTY